MAAITTAVGLGLAAVGAGTSILGSYKSSKANEEAIKAQQEAEAIRRQAMEIDNTRRRRQMFREQQILRSQALATTTNQGANQSSGLEGAYGQIAGRTAFGVAGLSTALMQGRALFDANQNLFNAKRAGSEAEMISGFGRGLSSLGGALVGNYGAINRIFGGGSYDPNYTAAVKYGMDMGKQ